MKTNFLASAAALSDQDLLTRIDVLAEQERGATAELVAHLSVLELRPSLYAAEGYGSLFAYCTEALRLSEDAACNRIAAARAGREFPVVLDLLGSGALTLSAIRMLRPHLTPENHESVLARAANSSGEQIKALIAELAPRPDVVASVRKLPGPPATLSPAPAEPATPANFFDHPASVTGPAAEAIDVPLELRPAAAGSGSRDDEGASDLSDSAPTLRPPPRPVVEALAPERYRVQFTIGQESRDKLRRVQALLCREIPNGDPGVIFERALDVFLERVEKAKLGAVAKRGRRRSGAGLSSGAYETRIRRAADDQSADDQSMPSEGSSCLELRPAPSRHIPSEIKRAVWWRDAGQCAFVSAAGHRCTERSFLELHHIQPYALNGPATLGNISLRCRRHNQHEAEMVFGGRL